MKTHNTHKTQAILGALILAASALLLAGCAEDEDDTIIYKYVTEYTYTAGDSQSVALSYEFDITGGFGVTTNSLTFGDDTFTFDWADEAELTNNDTSGTWWDGTTASLAISKGDFALRFAWRNSRDTSYSDVVLELFDGASNSWDWTFGSEVSDIWGDLADAALAIEGCYTEAVWDSDEGEYVVDEDATWVTPGTEDAFGGNYELVCVRVDSTLIVNATVLRSADNSIATYTIVTSGFSADTLSALLTGNPYFIDDVTWTYDENLDGTVTTGGDASSTANGTTISVNKEYSTAASYYTYYWDCPTYLSSSYPKIVVEGTAAQTTSAEYCFALPLIAGAVTSPAVLNRLYTLQVNNTAAGTYSTSSSSGVAFTISKAASLVDSSASSVSITQNALLAMMAEGCDWVYTFTLSGGCISIDIELTGNKSGGTYEGYVYTAAIKFSDTETSSSGNLVGLTSEYAVWTVDSYTLYTSTD